MYKISYERRVYEPVDDKSIGYSSRFESINNPRTNELKERVNTIVSSFKSKNEGMSA